MSRMRLSMHENGVRVLLWRSVHAWDTVGGVQEWLVVLDGWGACRQAMQAMQAMGGGTGGTGLKTAKFPKVVCRRQGLEGEL